MGKFVDNSLLVGNLYIYALSLGPERIINPLALTIAESSACIR